jgi:hypothetical protein
MRNWILAMCFFAIGTGTGCDCGGTTIVDNDAGSGSDRPKQCAVYHPDEDGDTFGDKNRSVETCSPAPNLVADGTDCNDGNAAINPRATELCDRLDNDCDGQVDEGFALTLIYFDSDRDGFGDPSQTRVHTTAAECAAAYGTIPDNFATTGGDCDDTDPDVHPNILEKCGNGLDDNCNGLADGAEPATQIDAASAVHCYPDLDHDLFGDSQAEVALGCECPEGLVPNNGDFNDASAAARPGAPEICDGIDNDGNEGIDEGLALTACLDQDGDGFGNSRICLEACLGLQPPEYVFDDTDCDDGQAAIHPTATEVVADGTDQDCDGFDACYRDYDNDGYGIAAIMTDTDLDCENGYGTSSILGDCDDGNYTKNPADRDMDGKSTCDDSPDCDDSDPLDSHLDRDQDGYFSCAPDPSLRDCDDVRDDVHPNAREYCDATDNDCDGIADEGYLVDLYPDRDGDLFGDATAIPARIASCLIHSGGEGEYVTWVEDNTDCNDQSANIHPGAAEIAVDGNDQNCDGFDACFADLDGDGFGSFVIVTGGGLECDGAGTSSVNTDCEDDDPARHPGDSDRDGYDGCGGDCDDSNPLIHPTATEYCNGRDDDCDGQTDENFLVTAYPDRDADSYGDQNAVPSQYPVCTGVAGLDHLPTGYVESRTDCNDGNAAINPVDNDSDGASECDPLPDCNDGNAALNVRDDDRDGATTCDPLPDCDDGERALNRLDEDGDGATTCDLLPDCDDDNALKNPFDIDLDGFRSCAASLPTTDCNDRDRHIYPGATEIRDNGIDEDCNGSDLTDQNIDDDRDGFTENQGDCNDSRSDIHPGASEVCDGADNDCDLVVDEGIVCGGAGGTDAGSGNDASIAQDASSSQDAASSGTDAGVGNDTGSGSDAGNGNDAGSDGGFTADGSEPDAAPPFTCPPNVSLPDGWCALDVPPLADPSTGPCSGEVMCLLDRTNDVGAPGADGRLETFCVLSAPMAQDDRPLNYHTPIPGADFAELFGDIYAERDGYITGYQGPIGQLPTGERSEVTNEQGYFCFNFARHNVGFYWFSFVSDASRGIGITDGCLSVLTHPTEGERTLCEVNRADATDFVYLHTDQICADPAPGSLAERVCKVWMNEWVFGLRYHNTQGLSTF